LATEHTKGPLAVLSEGFGCFPVQSLAEILPLRVSVTIFVFAFDALFLFRK